MKRISALLVAVLLLGVAGPAYAVYSVSNRGEWPGNWPEELESLREEARTLVGPLLIRPADRLIPQRHYAIPFVERERFESAWPHILKVKSEGAPIVLVRGRNFFLGDGGGKAGVVIHSPLAGQAEKPVAPGAADARQRSMHATYIELVVDGDIVDLNRIPLPADAFVVDKRFDTAERADAATALAQVEAARAEAIRQRELAERNARIAEQERKRALVAQWEAAAQKERAEAERQRAEQALKEAQAERDKATNGHGSSSIEA